MGQLVVVVETVVIRPEAERPMPFHTRIAPFGPPPHLLARADEELHLHLFELAHAEDELTRHDLVAERLADLGDTERQLHAAGLLHVQEIDEDTLCRLGTQVDRIGTLGRRAHLVENIRLNWRTSVQLRVPEIGHTISQSTMI